MRIMEYCKRNFTVKQRALLLILSIVLAIFLVASVTIKGKSGMTLFTRLFVYDNQTSNYTFPHETIGKSNFANLDYHLLASSERTIKVFSQQGEKRLELPVVYENPTISQSKTMAVLYDAGGQDLSVISSDEVLFSTSLPHEEFIISASINQNGWLAITSKLGGYKAVVTVYDDTFKPVVSIQLSSAYVSNAIVTPDCKGVYVLTEGQSEGVFESKLLYYRFDYSTTPTNELSLGDNLVLTMQTTNNRIWVLSENKLYSLLSSGEISSTYDYSEKYLKFANLTSYDFATILISHSPTGTGGELLTIGSDGFVIGRITVDESVLSISSDGQYVSILTANSVKLYNSKLKLIQDFDFIQEAEHLVSFSNGSIMLMTEELASLLIP